MKLVFAIVHDEDGARVIEKLNLNGFSVTKLASTGGFLRTGNTTLMVGVEDEKLDNVIAVIEKTAKRRNQMITSTMPPGGAPGMYMPYPVEITVGGATIFVVNVPRFEKL